MEKNEGFETESTNNQNIDKSAYMVQDSERKNLFSLTMVLAGYPIALSNFVIGGAVGVGMTFWDAIKTLIVGNAVLIAIATLTGMKAFETGYSTSFLSRRSFGRHGSSVFSFLLVISSVTWIALNAEIFASLIIDTFSWWILPVSITSVLCIGLWLLSAVKGFEGLEKVAVLGVPAALIMSIIGVVAAIIKTGGTAVILGYKPSELLSFSAGTASVVGGWVFGATISPDVCRFAKSKKDSAVATIIAFVLGCFGLQLAGAIVAIATGHGDFVVAMRTLGLVLVAFIAAVFALWTTQQNNIYGAALAVQNVFEGTKMEKVNYKIIATIVALVAAVFAFLDIYKMILPVVQFLSVLVPPVPAIIVAEEYIVKNNNEKKSLNVLSMIAWIVGGIASYLSLKADWFIPPVVGMLSSILIYVILSKLTPKKEKI